MSGYSPLSRILAQEHPLHVVAFGDANPGADPGVPLRSVDLAGTDRAAGT